MKISKWSYSLATSLRTIGVLALIGLNMSCGGGSGAVDDFIGGENGDNGNVNKYLLDLDPAAHPFGAVKTTNPAHLSKVVTVTNKATVTLYITTVSALTSPDFTIVNETCTALAGGLAPQSTCDFTVDFNPSTKGLKSYAVNLLYGIAAGKTDNAVSASFTGLGESPGELLISDGPTFDYGDVVLTATAEKVFGITNIGDYPASAMSASALVAPFAFKGGAYPGTGGTCGASLAAGATCYLAIEYSPTTTGGHSDTIAISYNDSDAAQSAFRTIIGTGATAANLTISNTNYDYGSLPIGATAEKTYTVTNTGGVSARTIAGGGLAAPFTFKGGNYPGTGGTCAGTLARTATCTIVVTYAPTATGLHTDSIELTYNDGLGAQTATNPIQGTGVTPANITISGGPTYNFGTHVVGSATDGTLTLTNAGGYVATALNGTIAAAPFTFKGGSYPGTGGTCTNSLPASNSCTVVLVYTPTVAGVQNSSFSAAYFNGLTSQISTRAVTGTATNPANLSISSGPTFNYGTKAIGSATDATFTISNSGGSSALSVTGGGLAVPFDFKGGGFPGTGGTCTATIANATSCTIVVTYSPVTAGTFNDAIDITYDTTVQTLTVSRAITGVGVTPATLAISDGPTYDFGTLPVGRSTDKTFTVTNGGGITATAISGSGLAAPYTFKNGSFPGTGGTCAATLAPSATCTFVVNYLPTASGTQTDAIDLAFNDGVTTQTSSRNLTAIAVAPANITISDGPSYDYGSAATGETLEKVFTLTNAGGFTASAMSGSGLALPFRFKGGSYPGTGGTCSSTLAAAATCDIVVTYSPTNVAAHSDAIDINYNNGTIVTVSSRAIQGLGATPANLTISNSPAYDFGNQPVGIVVTAPLTITNIGGVSALAMNGSGLTAPFQFDGGSYPGTGGTCGATLAPAATCTVVVQFNPTATGTYTKPATIGYNTHVVTTSVIRNVTGKGVTPASLSISASPTYNYGIVATGATKSATLTVTNGGAFAASSMSGSGLAAPYEFTGGSYPGTGANCSATLNAGSSCTISVSFSPLVTGVQTDDVEVNYSNGVTGQVATRGLTGTAQSPANITISDGPTYNYGTKAIGSVTDKTLVVTNGGGVSATSMTGAGLAAPFTFKGGSFPGTGGTCLGTLIAGASCNIVVTYSPTAVGTHTDTVDMAYNDGVTTQTAFRDVAGTAVTAALLTISDGPVYSYGTVVANTVNDHIFQVTNSGQTDATSLVGSGLAAPFSFKGGSYPGTGGTCGPTIVAGVTCDIVVTYLPTANGAKSDTIDLTYNNGTATAQVSQRNIQGVAAPAGVLSISNGATYNYGTVANTSVTEKTFTVTNTGGVLVTGIVATGLAAPFNFKGGTYPGTAGTCGLTLAAATSCLMVIEFSPIATGGFTDTLDLTYFNGASTQTSSRPMTGTAVIPAVLTVSNSPSYDYAIVATGGNSDKTFTVTNGGQYTATAIGGSNIAAPFTYKGGSFPGTGGNCGITLNAGASCTFVVRFAPTITGLQLDTIHVDYNNGASVQVATRDVQGTGAVPALLTVSDGPTYNFGTLASGGSGDKSFIVTNTGGVPATALTGTGLAAPFSFKGGSYPGTGGTCSTTLASAATCTVVLTYNPTNVAVHTDTLILAYDDGQTVGATNVTRDLTGTAVSPALLSVSDGPSFNFGTKATGSSTDKTFTVSNTGSFTASALAMTGLSAPFTYKGGSYPGAGGTCGATINASASCTIVVTYAPTANGTLTRTLSVAYNNGATAQTATRPMSGTGAAPALITISDGATYNYGVKATGSVTNKSFTITNTGGVAATTLAGSGLAAPFEFEGGTFPGSTGTCSTSLNAGNSCTVVIAFSPVATGLQNSQLDINYDNGVSGITVSRPVQGTGATPANLSVSDGPVYDYGITAIGNTPEKSFTITNTGGFAASGLAASGLAAPFNFKGGTFPGTGGTCTATLAASATCTVIIRFTPTTAVVSTDTVDFAYNDGAFPQSVSRDVSGTGVTPAFLAISDSPNLDFGNVVRLTTKDLTLTITNSGQLQATGISGTGLAAPFSYAGGTYPGTGGNCGTTLNAAASCTIGVRFSPTVVGAKSDSLDLSYNNAVTTVVVSRGLVGTGVTPATLVVSNSPTYAFGTRAIGGSTDATLTITNTGGFQATVIMGSGLNAPYSFKDGAYPGTGGTCTSSLASTATCTIVINYSPVAVATNTGTMTFNYFDGITAGVVSSRNVSGNGVLPATLSVSDGPTYDYGTVATGGLRDKTFTVTNSGNFAASAVGVSGLAAPFSVKGGTFPGTGGTCATTIAAGTNCRIVVTYAPTATGVQSDTIDVNYNDGANAQIAARAITGTGADPAFLSITDGPTYNFGTLASGGTADKTFTISNVGGVSATTMAGSGLAAPYSFKGGTYPGTGGTCAASLASSGSCTIVVTYNPTTIATHTDTIIIAYNDGAFAATSERDLTGNAVAPATLSISDGGTYDFGTRANGSVTEKTFTVTNTGSFSATSIVGSGLAAPYEFKGGSYPGAGGTCSASLAAAATCTMIVTFSPTVTGTHADAIVLTYFNGATSPTSSRNIQGVGAPPAVITISNGPTFNYGTKATGSTTYKTFTITNTGGVPATSLVGAGLAAPYDFEGGAYPGASGTCTNTLPSAGTCTISVTFSPVSTGLQADSIDFTYNNGVASGQTSNRAVQGTGAAPASLAISDSPLYDFGNIGQGGSADRTFTVTNSGGVQTESMAGTGLSAPFTFKGGSFPGTAGTCAANLAASATCTIVVNFSPTAGGLFSNTLNIAYNDGVSVQNITRNIQGTGVPPALLTISDGPTYNYGSVVQTTVAEKTFTVSNSGSLQATSMNGFGLAAPFAFKGGSYPGTGGNCSGTLATAATCTMVVTFSPATAVPSSDAIDLSYNNGVSSVSTSRAIQGTGTTPANLTISNSPTFSFGTIANTGSADGTLTISNTGGYQATSINGTGLSAPYSFKDGTYPGTGGTCSATIASGATCTIVLNFSPTVIGTQTGTVTIAYQNGYTTGGNVSVARNLTGTSNTPANLSISDGAIYDYGTVATGGFSDKTFTVTNTGNFVASGITGSSLTSPFAFAAGGAFPGGGTCGATLNAGATCTFTVRYSPVTTGAQSTTITVNYNNGAAATTSNRGVQGTGANPALLTLSDGATYSYGTLANGGTADHSFTVTNTGGVPATAMSGAGLAAPFSFKGGTYPGTGGTCATSLAISTTCTVVVTYNPTSVGVHNITLNIPYTDGVGPQTVTRDITGTAVAPALLAISDGPTYDFGTRANGSLTDKTFTITNTGSFSATSMAGAGLSAPITYKGGTYPGTGGSCSSSLAPAATCTIVTTFAPTAAGLNSKNINISYNNGAATQSSLRAVQGTGATPASLAVSDGPTYDYGTKATGSSTDKTFTITNSGQFTATSVSFTALVAPFEFKDGVFPGTGGDCTTSLAGAASCVVVVTYAPTGTGLNADAVAISYNDGVTTQNVSRAIQGTGAAPASLAVSDGATYNFGNIAVTGSAEKTFTITNSGGVPATSIAGSGLSAPFTFKGGTFPGTAGTCTTSLAAAATCTMVVVYAPTAGVTSNATINITYVNGVNAQSATRPVTGTGVTPATLTISDGPTYNYGNVVQTTVAEKTFTVTNTGSLTATALAGSGLTAPFAYKGGTFPGTGGNCPSSLNAGATCLVVATFSPSGTTTSASGTMSISYFNTLTTVSSTRAVQGTGVTPASITISGGPTFSFGTIANNGVVDGTLTVTNGGGYQATSVMGTGLVAPFEFKDGTYPGTGGTCGTTIAASATCTVVMTFSPTTIATHTGTLSIGYDSGLATVSSTRNVQGISVPPAVLTVSDASTYDYATVATGGQKDKTFTITNSGSVSATGIAGSGLAAPFTFVGGTFPGGGSCTTTLAASASCTFVVRYAPVATGLQSDTIDIAYNDGAQAQTTNRPVQGTGAAPAVLTISDGITYDYGTVANGSSTDKTFTVSNTGGVPATGIAGSGLAAPYSFKAGTFPGTGGTCSTSLSSATTCTIVVTYNPTSNTTHTDTIDITYNDGVAAGNTVSRALTGTAVSAASLLISDGPTYNYGTKANGSVTEKTFTVTNAGSFGATSMTGSGLAAPFEFKGGTYPGSGGTCATTLAGAATCTMIVTFSPTVTGSHSDSIDMTYNNGALAGQTANRALSAASAAPALLAVSDGATFDFGTKATGSSTDKTFTISNSGGVAATSLGANGLAAPFTFKGGSYPGTLGTCSTSLNAANTCTIVVTYAPTGTGLQADALDVNYDDGVTAQTSSRAVQGTGAAPANITISDGPTYDFGNVAVGATPSKTLTITNGGGVPATAMGASGLATPYSLKGGTYPGTAGTCTTTLAASASCTVVVEFAPGGVGVASDALDIGFNNGVIVTSSSRALTGNGVAPAQLDISDGSTYNFGNVVATTTAEKTFTITNSGSLQATSISGSGLASPYSFKGGSFPGTGGSCVSTLAAAATCTFVVEFTPPSAGSSTDTIDIAYNNGVSAQVSNRPVQGNGVTAALLTVSNGPTFNFGTIANNGTVDATLTVTNSGGFAATSVTGSGLAAPFTFKGGGAFPGTGGTCTATIAPSASCTVTLTYSPTTLATHTDALSVDYHNGISNQSSLRNLSGTAVAPASLTISDSVTYDYGTVATGGTKNKTFTITNSGAVSATSVAGAGLGTPFTYAGGTFPGGGTCATTLASGASCTFIVTYAPIATGLQSNSITVNYNDGAQAQSATRGVQGTGANPALLTVSDGAVYDYGTKANGSSTDKSFTITNTGGVDATAMAGSGLAAPFSFKNGTYPGTGGTCSATLASGATCIAVVTYNPTTVAAHSDAIDIGYNDGVTTQTVSRGVQGTAVSAANLVISDAATYNFGTQANGSSTDKTFTITNSGSFTASISTTTAGLAAPYTFKGGGNFPGSGGSCSATLAGAATCTFVVTFAPLSTGSYNDSVDVTYNNGAVAGQTSSRAITGASAAPASLAISDGVTYDYGTKATGSSTDKTFTITNSGGVPAASLVIDGIAAPYTFKDGTFPGTGGTCAASLAAGNTCLIVVTYAPTGTGVQNDSIDIVYNDGVTTQNIARAITGTGANPAALTISDVGYDFGSIAIGAAPEKTFTVTNGGGVSATSIAGSGLSAPFTFKGGAFPGTGTCTATLAASATCTIIVVYTPTAAVTSNGTMTLTFNNGVSAGQTSTRAIAGTGVAPALLTISDAAPYNYGNVVQTGSADKTFTITNTGSLGATGINGSGLAAPFTFPGGFPGSGGNCTATLAPAATCTVVARFAPTSTGAQTDTMDIGYNNGVSAQTSSKVLQGTGATPAAITIGGANPFSFGSIANNGTVDGTVTITNTGGVPATSLGVTGVTTAPYSFKGGGAFPGTGGTCTTSLAASASCTFVLTFSPTTLGTHTGTMSVGFDNGLTTTASTRNYTGTAVAPASLTVSDVGYDYGTVATGGTASKTFTISNSGAVSATSLTGTGLAAPFAFPGSVFPGGGTCSTTLAAGATCTVIVTFSPSATGAQGDTLDIGYNDGAQAQTASRAVTGTGAAPASLAISDGVTYDFGNVANGGTMDKTFTVTNSGGVASTGMSGSGLAAPYTFKGGTYPGSTGTCSATLAAASTCTMVVTFAPTSLGTLTDTIDLTYTNGVTGGNVVSRALTGVGVAPATITISDGATYNFGAVATTATLDKTFTITNTGAIGATALSGSALSAPFSYSGGSFPGAAGNCTSTLAAGATCLIEVRFSPTVVTTSNATMTLTYNNGVVGGQTSARAMQGSGVTAASLTVSDGATYNYGNVAQNGTADKTFTITNGGGATATLVTGSALAAPYSYKGGGAFPGTGGTCTGSLAGAATCTYIVTYSPTTLAVHNATTTITYTNGVTAGQTTTRPMTGTGVAPATLTLNGSDPVSFGTIPNGSSAELTFTVTNSGSYAATTMTGSNLSSPFAFKGGTYPGSGGTCSASLNPAATCTVIITYIPVGTGTTNQTINIGYNDGAGPQTATRDITGTAVGPAVLTISDGATYDFGTVATTATATKTFTITNAGGFQASAITGTGLSAPFTYNGGTFPGTGGNCAATLAAAATCTIVVKYSPTASVVTNQTVNVTYNNGVSGGQSATRPITGTGALPASITISDTNPYDYGNVVINGSSDHAFTLTNSGGITATSLSASGLTAPFAYKGGSYPGTGGTCATTLAGSNATCTIVVTYSPTGAGSQNSILNISYFDGAVTQTPSRTMQGVGSSPALLTVSNAVTYDFGTVANGSTNDKTFTVTNSGGVSALSMTGSGLSAPYGFKGGSYPGTGGTCSGTLASGASCTFVVNYSPTTLATHTATISINYNDQIALQAATRPLTGTAVGPAVLTVSDGPTYDYGNVYNNLTADKTFTVTNSGGYAASSVTGSGLATPYSYKGGSFPGTGGSCSTALGTSSSCTFVATFAPLVAGVQNATASVDYNNGASVTAATRALTGTGITPTPPSTPPSPTVAVTVAGRLDITWTASTGTGPLTYDVLRALSAGGTYTAVQTGLTVVTWNDTGVTNGTTYYYKIRVNGPGGQPMTVTPTAGTPIANFTIASALSGNKSIIVTWPAAAGASTYTVKYGTVSGAWPSIASTAATSSYTITNLVPGTPYFVQVAAVNANGSLDSTGEETATPYAQAESFAPGQASNSMCAIMSTGELRCWGQATYGMIGNGAEPLRGDDDEEIGNGMSPVKLGTGLSVTQLAPSRSQNWGCAVLNNQKVKCWGINSWGNLGIGNTISQSTAASNSGDNLQYAELGTGFAVAKVAVGSYHACALSTTGRVKCWGRNANGELGEDGTTQRGDGPGEMGDSRNFSDTSWYPTRYVTDIVAGDQHTCALFDNGTVKCWGANNRGQLGIGSTTSKGYQATGNNMASLTGINLGTGKTATQLGAMANGACVLLNDGTIKCWGQNNVGQLGQGDVNDRGDDPGEMGDSLVTTPIGTTVAQLATGWHHACVRFTTGAVKCWGQGSDGKLGIGTTADMGDAAGEVAGLANIQLGGGGTRTATFISAGTQNTCAALDNNTVKCWGIDNVGQLGRGSSTTYATLGDGGGEMDNALPAATPQTGRTFVAAYPGNGMICYLEDNGTAVCNGNNIFGQLGIGQPAHVGDDADEMGAFLTKVDVGTGLTVSKVAMGATHTCVIVNTGQVKCFGRNNYGQLGYGDKVNRGSELTDMGDNLPFVDLNGKTAKDITAGQHHTCAILSDDTTRCWGRNSEGQLGRDNTASIGDNAGEMGSSLGATNVGSGRYAVELKAGNYHTCARLDNATMKCWGYNNRGQLGQNSTANLGDGSGEMAALAVVPGVSSVAEIGAGNEFSCARTTAGAVKCWGRNASGQLGQGNTNDLGDNESIASLANIDLGTGLTATSISVGGTQVCATLNNNTIKCWGNGGNGRLGKGNQTSLGDNGAEMGDNLTAISIGTGLVPSKIVTQNASTCTLTTVGTVRCWGYNAYGTLGIGNTTQIGDGGSEMGDNLLTTFLYDATH